VAKATAFWQVANYREAYGLFACTGILANHESPLRPNRFVTQKIIQGVKAIAEGKQEKLVLGNVDIWRDWGWAPDYVEAMHRIMQAEKPQDYVIASGLSHSLKEFAQMAFAYAHLESVDRLQVTSDLMRPSDLTYSSLDPSKIARELDWQTNLSLESVIAKMMQGSIH